MTSSPTQTICTLSRSFPARAPAPRCSCRHRSKRSANEDCLDHACDDEPLLREVEPAGPPVLDQLPHRTPGRGRRFRVAASLDEDAQLLVGDGLQHRAAPVPRGLAMLLGGLDVGDRLDMALVGRRPSPAPARRGQRHPRRPTPRRRWARPAARGCAPRSLSTVGRPDQVCATAENGSGQSLAMDRRRQL